MPDGQEQDSASLPLAGSSCAALLLLAVVLRSCAESSVTSTTPTSAPALGGLLLNTPAEVATCPSQTVFSVWHLYTSHRKTISRDYHPREHKLPPYCPRYTQTVGQPLARTCTRCFYVNGHDDRFLNDVWLSLWGAQADQLTSIQRGAWAPFFAMDRSICEGQLLNKIKPWTDHSFTPEHILLALEGEV